MRRRAYVGAEPPVGGLSPGGVPDIWGTIMSMRRIDHRPLPLRGHLVNQGITLQDFADSVGRSPSYVSRVLHGKRPVSRDFAVDAADRLGLSLDEAALLLGPRETWGRGRWPTAA